MWPQTHSDDVVLPEAQLVIVVTLKVEQRLCSSPPVTGHDEEVFVISLVALHGVVRSKILYHTQRRLNAPAGHVLRTPGTSGSAGTHGAGVVRVQTVEVFCCACDGFSERRHQLRLLYVLGFQGVCLILSEQQGAQRGPPVQGLSPHHLNTGTDTEATSAQAAQLSG